MTEHPCTVRYHDDCFFVEFTRSIPVYADGLHSRAVGVVKRLEIRPNGATYWRQTDVYGSEAVGIEVQR